MKYWALSMRIKGLSTLLVCMVVFLPCSSWSRTVSLVYDDSGSMLGKHKWSNANYAVQVLSALLKDTDTLFCVRMNGAQDGELFELTSQKRRISLERIRAWPAPVDGAKTPYQSVETAARSVFELRGDDLRGVGVSDADWLLIITDGEFQKTDNKLQQKQYYERVKEHASTFFSTKEGRNIRIAFLLIGADADEKTASIWRKEAPASEQVTIFRSGASDIAGSMEKIAQLIAGRDEHSIQPEKSEKVLKFSSIFPVSRFTIFEQHDNDDLSKIIENGVSIPDGALAPKIRGFNIQTPYTKKVWGRTTHVSTGEVMSAGEYSITFDRDISKRSLNLIVEPSVDFRIVVLDTEGNELEVDNSGKYKICDNERIRFQVKFMSLRGGKWVEHPIDGKVASGLDVHATLNRKQLSLSYDVNNKDFITKEMSITEKSNLVHIEAKYPGYFHIKSHALPIESEACEKNISAQFKDIVIPVHYSESEIFNEVGSVNLIRSGDLYDGKSFLSAPELPEGVRLEFQGKSVESSQDIVEVDFKPEIKIKVLTNKQFISTQSVSFGLKLSTNNPRVKIAGSGVVVLQPQPRKIALVPVEELWACKFDKVGETAGPIYSVVVDDQKILKEQLENYSLIASTDKRINIEAVTPISGDGFQLKVEPFFVRGLTDVGNIPVLLELSGPLAGEKTTLKVVLHIEELSLWERLRFTLLALLGLLILLMWLIGCIRKNRFSGTSYIEYTEKKIGLSQRKRPVIYYLSAGKCRSGKFFKLIVAYCWPFGDEKQGVEGMVFFANFNSNSILLSKVSQSPGMKVGTRKLTKNDAGKDNVMLTSGEKITVTTNAYQKTYIFKNQ
jgi:hypothetical protein